MLTIITKNSSFSGESILCCFPGCLDKIGGWKLDHVKGCNFWNPALIGMRLPLFDSQRMYVYFVVRIFLLKFFFVIFQSDFDLFVEIWVLTCQKILLCNLIYFLWYVIDVAHSLESFRKILRRILLAAYANLRLESL